ncbi:MAG: glycosyltransferase, partial [Dehalococcoidia bacterium]
MSKPVGILYDNISGNTGDRAIGISVRKMLSDMRVDFDELVISRFNPGDYNTIIVGGGYLLQPSRHFIYDKFRVPGQHILNCCGVYGHPDDLDYLNEYRYLTVRSRGDKDKLSYLHKEVKVVPCTTMLLNDLAGFDIEVKRPALGIHLWQGPFDDEPLIEYLNSLPFHIYFLPITHYNHDFKYLEKISSRIKNSTALPIMGPEEILTAIGKFNYFISMSLHGAIFSFMHNVPFILVDAGTDKMRFFLEDRGMAENLVWDLAGLEAKFDMLQSTAADYSQLLQKDLTILKEHKQRIRDILPKAVYATQGKPEVSHTEESGEGMSAELQEAHFQITYLKGQVAALRDIANQQKIEAADKAGQIDQLSYDLQAEKGRVRQLGNDLQAKTDQLVQLNDTVQSQNMALQQIMSGSMMKLMARFKDRAEKMFPPGSKRGHYYDLALRALRILISYGWKCLWSSGLTYLKYPQRAQTGTPAVEEKELKARMADFLDDPHNKLHFPESGSPRASIVVLAFNKAEYTYHCLESILAHTEIPYQMVIVDNASTDKTADLLGRLENVVILRNPTNTGFVGGCNLGASSSSAPYVMFLNNDTEVTHGWLSSLVEIMDKDPLVGAAGSKIVSFDGRLQEAGSIVWSDGTALGYGRGDDPEKPEYSYLREVDYCSACCLLVRRELFEKLGGFDRRY